MEYARYGTQYPHTAKILLTSEGELFYRTFARQSEEYAGAITKAAALVSVHSIQALDIFSTVVFYSTLYRRKTDTPLLIQKLCDTKPFLALSEAEKIVSESKGILNNLKVILGKERGKSTNMQICLA
jgi:hypothetical protein